MSPLDHRLRSGSHRLDRQEDSYRRGLVLGLTMAEVGILIIFILLLLLVLTEVIREAEALSRRGTVAVPEARYQLLKTAESAVSEIAEAIGDGANDTPEDIQRLIRVLIEASKSSGGKSALDEARRELNAIREARKRMTRVADAAGTENAGALVEGVEKYSFELANKEAVLRRLEAKLVAAGLGKGERPCWVKPDGSIEYLYEVVLTNAGIRMKEIVNVDRNKERERLPLPVVEESEVLTPYLFALRTRPLFDESLAQNCRFFVIVYDDTGEHEKELYKKLLRVVEGHFYKLAVDGRPPF